MKDEGILIDEPAKRDVLFGRSSTALKHSGNVTFRNIIAMKADEYNNAISRPHKTLIVVGIVDMVTMQGGRFLKADGPSKKWRVVDRATALNKTGHCMRDKVTKMQKSTPVRNEDKKKEKELEDRNYPGLPKNPWGSTIPAATAPTGSSFRSPAAAASFQSRLAIARSRAASGAQGIPDAPFFGLPFAALRPHAAAADPRLFAASAGLSPFCPLLPGLVSPPLARPAAPMATMAPLADATRAIGAITGAREAAGQKQLKASTLARLEKSKRELIEATKLVEAQKQKMLETLQALCPDSVTSIEINTGV